MDINYKSPGPVASEFLKSDKFVRGLRGPFGSGKSVACCIALFIMGSNVPVGKRSKKRRSRFAVVRNSQPMLKTTTLKTWLEWFPEEEFGPVKWAPPITHNIMVDDMEMEVIFVGMDQEKDVKRVFSMDLTGAWINEAREIQKPIVDAITSRLGRFPPQYDAKKFSYGLVMDTNAMDEMHWWPLMSGETQFPEDWSDDDKVTFAKPGNWEFFSQPGAVSGIRDNSGRLIDYNMNEQAENLDNLPDSYYRNLITGKRRDWVSVFVENQLGITSEGRSVYESSFSNQMHVRSVEASFVDGREVIIGVDFGLNFAAVFVQDLGLGRFRIMKELVLPGYGAVRAARMVKRFINNTVPPNVPVRLVGDPTGDNRASTDENTPMRIFAANGLPVNPAPTNDPTIRIEAVEAALNRLVDGAPGLEMNPSCITLKRGFIGGYFYPEGQEVPSKNRFSHPHDALQYALLGAGEGTRILSGANPSVSVSNVREDMSALGRYRSRIRSRNDSRLRSRR